MKTEHSEICEKEAIERAKNGDPIGLSRLYEMYRPRIYALCMRHTNNDFDAEDLTQEIFILVFRKVSTFRGEAQFTTWLYKVAINTVRLHARQRRRQDRFIVSITGEEALCSVHSRFYNPAQGIALRQALGSLTPVRRSTVLLHDVGGLTHNEVAWQMGVSVIASKSRLHQAHVALRNMLGSVPEGAPPA